MKRRCEESVPLLGPYLDGELPEEDLVWLEEHLADCDPCTARKNLLIAQAEALRERAAARVRDVDLGSVADAVFARIDREGPRTAPPLSVWGLEMWGAHRKSELLAKVAGTPIQVVAPDGRVFSSDDIDTRDEIE